MANCSAVWIVAPINRAVDDKAASKLLGNSFKLKLRMDGSYSNVTFVCTKTDEISISEAMDGLGLHDELAAYQLRSLQLQEALEKSETLAEGLAAVGNAQSESLMHMDKDIADWEVLRQRVDRGETVYPPVQTATPKRKRYPTMCLRSHKNGDREESEDSEPDPIQVATGGDLGCEAGEPIPLTPEVVASKLSEMRDSGETLKNTLDAGHAKFKKAAAEVRRLESEIQVLEAARPIRRCIQGRNEYSIKRIKEDFAAGVRE